MPTSLKTRSNTQDAHTKDVAARRRMSIDAERPLPSHSSDLTVGAHVLHGDGVNFRDVPGSCNTGSSGEDEVVVHSGFRSMRNASLGIWNTLPAWTVPRHRYFYTFPANEAWVRPIRPWIFFSAWEWAYIYSIPPKI